MWENGGWLSEDFSPSLIALFLASLGTIKKKKKTAQEKRWGSLGNEAGAVYFVQLGYPGCKAHKDKQWA